MFSVQFKQGKVGPDGKELIPHESPTVNGYGFETMPSPVPGKWVTVTALRQMKQIKQNVALRNSTYIWSRFLKAVSVPSGVAESPLMTWGEIESTPFRLEGSETPYAERNHGPSFKVVYFQQ